MGSDLRFSDVECGKLAKAVIFQRVAIICSHKPKDEGLTPSRSQRSSHLPQSRLRAFERFSEVAYRLRERVAIEHRREQLDIQIGQHAAAVRADERSVCEDVDLDDSFEPVPDLVDAELAVDLQPVDAAAGPF